MMQARLGDFQSMQRARKEKKNLVMNSSVIKKKGHATTVANLAKKLTTVDF
jgi:hypothetical protein